MTSKKRRGHSPAHQGFDFSGHMRRLCEDMASRLPELRHIQIDHVGIGYATARKRVSHGILASLTPLRFEAGSRTTVKHGRRWTVPRLHDRQGRELLYLLRFYLPRFLDYTYQEKLNTIVHELWHIGPLFNGDLRRFPGRCYAHSHSQKKYDAAMEQLALKWLSLSPPANLTDFLHFSASELARLHGTIHGIRLPTVALIPVGNEPVGTSQGL